MIIIIIIPFLNVIIDAIINIIIVIDIKFWIQTISLLFFTYRSHLSIAKPNGNYDNLVYCCIIQC